LLEEAGVPDGFSFPLLITPDDESIRVASIYAAMCQEVGINIELQQVEFGTILARMGEANYAGAQIELSPRNDPDLSAHPWFHTRGGVNFSHYSSAKKWTASSMPPAPQSIRRSAARSTARRWRCSTRTSPTSSPTICRR
jgi:ABC-type transport system substrate-binding protein